MKNSAVSLKWHSFQFLRSSGGLRELRWGGVFTPSFPFPGLVAVDLFIDRTAQHLHLHRDHPEESKGIERVRRLFNASFADLLFLSLLVAWQNPSQREYVVVVGLVYGRGLPFDFDSNKKMNVTLTSLFADSIKWKSIAEENNSTSSQSAAVSHLFFFFSSSVIHFFYRSATWMLEAFYRSISALHTITSGPIPGWVSFPVHCCFDELWLWRLPLHFFASFHFTRSHSPPNFKGG